MNIRLCVRLSRTQSHLWIARDVDLPAVPREGEIIGLSELGLAYTVALIWWDVASSVAHVRMSNLDNEPIDLDAARDAGWAIVDGDPANPEYGVLSVGRN